MSYEVIVVGAGHNGLVAAGRLAKAGRKVLLLEAQGQVGGLCAAREFHPGYTVPGLLHDTAGLRAGVVDALGLEAHELKRHDAASEPGVVVPDPNGHALTLYPGRIQGGASGDENAFEEWRRFIGRVGPFLRTVLDRKPPSLATGTPSELLDLARRGLSLRMLGKDDMRELMRVVPMCVADWVGEAFSNRVLCEALCARAVLGDFMGPWSAGTAALLLFRECTEGYSVQGGPAALVRALSAAVKRLGVETRTSSPVQRIDIAAGKVTGVTLESGETMSASVVVAACDPKRTFLELCHPASFSMTLHQQVRNLRTRGSAAKVHLALDGAPEWKGLAEAERLYLGGGHVDELERAFDAVKYRRFSERPCLDVSVPTLSNPQLAPAGHHVVSVLVGYAPYQLDGGWTDARREALGDAVVDTLARYAPDIRRRIVGREVLTPVDLEHTFLVTGGHLHHGEQALDQLLFMRPTPGTARYATPIGGLYLGSSGSHPGGGVTGAPGALCADAVLNAQS